MKRIIIAFVSLVLINGSYAMESQVKKLILYPMGGAIKVGFDKNLYIPESDCGDFSVRYLMIETGEKSEFEIFAIALESYRLGKIVDVEWEPSTVNCYPKIKSIRMVR